MEYQDFTIDLQSVEGGGFEAIVESLSGNVSKVSFTEPLDWDVLEQLLASFDAADEKIEQKIQSLPISLRKIGEQVSAALFKNGLSEHFQSCSADALSRGASGLRLRLRFRIDDPQAGYLAAVPWERLCDPNSAELLAIDQWTPVVREIAVPRPRAVLAVEPPLRILVVDAAPMAMKELNLKLEIERMEEALEPLMRSGVVELLRLAKATKNQMRDALLDEEIHVLHFMGHGGYHSATGTGAIFFEKDDGTKDQVDGQMLAAYLKLRPGSNLRLVVLNACKTARHGVRTSAPLSHGVAPAVLRQTRVPAVVANQFSISDAAAIDFSRVFYERIAAGYGIDEAITEARLRLWTKTQEWATPVLFLGASSGKILTVKPSERRSTVRALSVRAEDQEVRLGVLSIDGWGRDIKQRNEYLLDLRSCFNGRYIKEKSWWQERIFPDLRSFLERRVDQRRPLLLDFAAHSSIAFAAGWLLKPKSGLAVSVRQRTGAEGELEWHPKDSSEPEGSLWQERPDIILSSTAPEVAVALSVSQPNVADHVKKFVEQKNLSVGRILDVTIFPEPHGRSVKGGAHALLLAQALLSRLQTRFPHEREGRIHFFCAAPNALVFYLGQLASSLGTVVLYEFPFDAENSFGRYQQSIELPPPGEARWVAEDW
jgi:hypothetical protein